MKDWLNLPATQQIPTIGREHLARRLDLAIETSGLLHLLVDSLAQEGCHLKSASSGYGSTTRIAFPSHWERMKFEALLHLFQSRKRELDNPANVKSED